MKPSADCHRELCLLMNRRIVAQLSAIKIGFGFAGLAKISETTKSGRRQQYGHWQVNIRSFLWNLCVRMLTIARTVLDSHKNVRRPGLWDNLWDFVCDISPGAGRNEPSASAARWWQPTDSGSRWNVHVRKFCSTAHGPGTPREGEHHCKWAA